ncbi:MAG TPA: hypothetical protein VF006_30630 [Longimicrobium sp.]
MGTARIDGPAKPRDEADHWRDEPELARQVVRNGAGVLDDQGLIIGSVGAVSILTPEEKSDFDEVQRRIRDYLAVENPRRPLCLGVFGPPGSGKSFGVEQVLKELLGHEGETLNLSQMEGPRQLAERVKKAVGRDWGGQVPALFFDEFDSRLAGTPLGWLQWLLAPMQDGRFTVGDEQVEVKRAIFVFAGGTADTFEDFQGGPAQEFRAAKGPDFVSRLRGHLNVRGVNSWPYRRVRRAQVLRRALEKGAPGLLDDAGHLPPDRMDDAFIDQLLGVGRYRHGARSVEALVEMSTRLDPPSFTRDSLPGDAVRANHVDLGPLGDLVVTLSAGGTRLQADGSGDYHAALDEVWQTVATRLLEQGVALIYGGDPRRGGFLERLVAAHERLPRLLPSREAEREPEPGEGRVKPPRAGTLTWVRERADRESTGTARWEGMRELDWPELSDEEMRELGLEPGTSLSGLNRSASPVAGSLEARKRFAYAVRLFRMRALVTRLADAHLAFGGRETGFSGRFPGIAEEVMLSLAAGTPVYLCGGFGGGTRAVGEALGLGPAWAAVPRALRVETHGDWAILLEEMVRARRGIHFQLPHRADLPLDYHDLVKFLNAHALEGPRWPDNGLNPDENRALFVATGAGEIFALVEKGLRRLGKG